jgi:hypothetical protein
VKAGFVKEIKKKKKKYRNDWFSDIKKRERQ